MKYIIGDFNKRVQLVDASKVLKVDLMIAK